MKTKPDPKPKPGRPPKTGRTATVVSVSLLPDKLDIVDSRRGELSRGRYLGSLIPKRNP